MSKQQYRTQTCIMGDMMNVISEGGQKGVIVSQITLKANLSYYAVVAKCEKLEKAGLVETKIQGQNRVYCMTEKGIKFFQEFQRFHALAESMNLKF